MLNVAQASAIQAYFGLGVAEADGARNVLFALRSTDQSELAGRFDARRSPHLRLWVDRDDSRQLHDLSADAEATAMVLERAGKVLVSTRAGQQRLAVVNDALDARSGLKGFCRGAAQGHRRRAGRSRRCYR